MFIVGSVLSSLALASAPAGVAPDAAALQNSTANVYADDLFAGEDIFAGETPLTNAELKSARGGIALRGQEYGIGAQISRDSMQSLLTATETVRRAPSGPVNTGVGPVALQNNRGGRGANIAPVNTGVGPVNNGVAPANVGPANVGPVNVGSVNVNVGPVNTGVAPVETAVSNTGVGPVELNVGPVEIATGPVDTGVGPVAVNAGPVDIEVGPVDVNVGPVTIDVGPVNTDAGPVVTDVVPTTPVQISAPPVNVPAPGPVETAGPPTPPAIVPEAPGPSQSFQSAINNIQVVMDPNATVDVYSGGPADSAQNAGGAPAGQHIFHASVPLNENLENLVISNSLSNITIERTINIQIELPFDLNETIIRPAADMHALSRSLSGAAMLRGFSN